MWFNKYGLNVHAHYDINTQRINVFAMDRPQYGPVTTLVSSSKDYDSGHPFAPVLALEEPAAQDLMNSLWDAGVRPVGAKGSAGQLDAVQRHLEDMRALAFDKFGVEAP
jgi:hypothetical protein